MIDQQIKRLIRIRNPSDPLQYAHDLVRDIAYEKLCDTIKHCQDCPIHEGVRTLPKGRIDAPVMVVSEAATYTQQNLNTDFVQAASQKHSLFEAFLGRYGIDQDNVFYVNTINCFPSRINEQGETVSRTPTVQEVTNCQLFVDYAISLVQPKLIIVLGAVALNIFKKKVAISQERGQLFEINRTLAMATYHPDYFNKIADKKDPELVDELKIDFEQDLLSAFQAYEKKYPGFPLMTNPKGEC